MFTTIASYVSGASESKEVSVPPYTQKVKYVKPIATDYNTLPLVSNLSKKTARFNTIFPHLGQVILNHDAHDSIGPCRLYRVMKLETVELSYETNCSYKTVNQPSDTNDICVPILWRVRADIKNSVYEWKPVSFFKFESRCALFYSMKKRADHFINNQKLQYDIAKVILDHQKTMHIHLGIGLQYHDLVFGHEDDEVIVDQLNCNGSECMVFKTKNLFKFKVTDVAWKFNKVVEKSDEKNEVEFDFVCVKKLAL
jgi:hypothetical protein